MITSGEPVTATSLQLARSSEIDKVIADIPKMMDNGKATNSDLKAKTRDDHQLPNEIISLIISHLGQLSTGTLYQCTLTSKTFYDIANPQLWRDMGDTRFFQYAHQLPHERLVFLVQHIHVLDLHDSTNDDLGLIAPYLTQLQLLIMVSSPNITNTSFQHLIFPQLTSVTLLFTYLTYDAFAQLAHHCPKLTRIDWYLSNVQEPSWLTMFRQPLERISLHLRTAPLDPATIDFIKQSHHLKSLDISADRRLFIQPDIWPHLTDLTLRDCDAINDTTLLVLLRPQLRQLTLEHATLLTDATIDALSPLLTHLKLTQNPHISADAIRRLVRRCPLEFIIFSMCALEEEFSEYLTVCFNGSILDSQAIDRIRHADLV